MVRRIGAYNIKHSKLAVKVNRRPLVVQTNPDTLMHIFTQFVIWKTRNQSVMIA
jgi:hypothetical protein